MIESFIRPVCDLLASSEMGEPARFAVEDWRGLEAYALAQGLAPLLYWRFRQSGWPAGMPEEVRGNLTQAYYANFARNTLLFSELGRVLVAYAQAGIPVTVLKGAALAPVVYENIALRPMGDLDLLVPRIFFPAALKIVQELGYEEIREQVVPQLDQLVDYHVHLRSVKHKVDLELHWNLVASEDSWYTAPVGWFWENTEPYPFEEAGITPAEPGSEIRVFTPAAMLLHLAGHAMLQHGSGHILLVWLYDIHALIHGWFGNINWDLLVRQARNWGWAHAMRAALVETRDCFGTRLPEGVLEALESTTERRAAFLVGLKKRFPRARLMGDWYTLLSLRWPARLRYVFAMVFPRREYIRWRYHPQPAWLWPLYYPYRWVRAAWDGFGALARLVWRSV